jgi:hypothetical protein
MPWLEKGIPAPLDTTPPEGRADLVGDVLAAAYGVKHSKGKKYPLIHFASGHSREFHASKRKPTQPLIHIFGAMHLPYNSDCDTAYELALKVADDYDGYQVATFDNHVLAVRNLQVDRAYMLTYNNQAGHLVNIQPGWDTDERMELLPSELRAILPPLYTNEKQEMEAVAPIKYFTPDSNWSWYPTEFDGQDVFFGLVSGMEVELGYFSLSELEGVRGMLYLPVERDLYYTPTKLKDLRRMHTGY